MEKDQKIDKITGISKKRKIALEEECTKHAATTKELGLQGAKVKQMNFKLLQAQDLSSKRLEEMDYLYQKNDKITD